MKIEELKQLLNDSKDAPKDFIALIKKLRTEVVALPDTELIEKNLDPAKHNVMDKAKRKDRLVKIDENQTEIASYYDEDAELTGTYRIEPVARIALALQKLIVKRAVSFTFGNPVQLNFSPQDDKQKQVLNAIKKILLKNKEVSLNRKIGKILFSCKEVAEIWFTVPDEKNEIYGIKSNVKLKVSIFNPLKGDKLYDTYDDYGDLIAFSREFEALDKEGNKINYFETYTDENAFLWVKAQGADDFKLMEGYPKKNEIGKIPIVYGRQEETEWEDVQGLIERLETLLSNFADVIDYNANPMIFFKGRLTGFGRKGEAGKILEGDSDSDAKYLSWSDAPEAVKLEIETLLRLIYTITQTPDISFESIKGLSAISGRALKMLFLDAHLKVQEKQEVLSEYMTRRINIIKSYIGLMDNSLNETCKAIDIEPEIIPYMIDDEETKIQILATATGGKSILSQKTAVEQLNYTNDSEKEYELLKEEEQGLNVLETLEPTV
jgi:SPP1 family phage portal protein